MEAGREMGSAQVFFVHCLLDIRRLVSVVCAVNVGKQTPIELPSVTGITIAWQAERHKDRINSY